MKKSTMILITIIFVILTIGLILTEPSPEFFDIFGLIVFTFILYTGFLILKSKKKIPDTIGFLLLLIGILGLIVDFYNVIKHLILGG